MAFVKCKKNYARNPKTNRCKRICPRYPSGRCHYPYIPCKPGYVRNPKTNRCRKIKKPSKKAPSKKSKKTKGPSKKPKAKDDEYWEINSVGEPRLRKKPKTTPKTAKNKNKNTKTPSRITPAGVGDNCAVCLSEMKRPEKRCRMKCSNRHVFHDACAKPWLRTKKTCPICRERVTGCITI